MSSVAEAAKYKEKLQQAKNQYKEKLQQAKDRQLEKLQQAKAQHREVLQQTRGELRVIWLVVGGRLTDSPRDRLVSWCAPWASCALLAPRHYHPRSPQPKTATVSKWTLRSRAEARGAARRHSGGWHRRPCQADSLACAS